MKKFFALFLALGLLFSCASASARTVFDPNREKIHFVVLDFDDEAGETFTAVWTFKTVMSKIEKGENFLELLAMECDGFIPAVGKWMRMAMVTSTRHWMTTKSLPKLGKKTFRKGLTSQPFSAIIRPSREGQEPSTERGSTMKNFVATALISNYGFEVIRDNMIYAGRGSWFSAGQLIEITFNGDLATIDHRKWFYNCDGDCVYDTRTTTTCHLSQVWGFLPEWVLSKR